jgi:hypothetical protein
MNAPNYATTLAVDQSPKDAFEAINNPRGWWSEDIQGPTDALNAEFTYHYRHVHRATFRITEFIPEQKVVWHVLDNYFNFVQDHAEWKGTDVVFEITKKGGKTEVRFTHVGLVPAFECYDVCSNAWGGDIAGSLKSLIATGKGKPNTKES